jgi:hypothetical protein
MTKRCRSDHEIAEDIARSLDDPPAPHDPGNAGAAARAWLSQARDAGGGDLRQQHLQRAQREIARLDPAHHGALVQYLQAQVLALQGRGGDTKIAHVTPGEIVIPRRLQTPELMRALAAAARASGFDPAALQVGSGRNVINPHTGQPQFDEDDLEDDGTDDGDGYDADAGADQPDPSMPDPIAPAPAAASSQPPTPPGASDDDTTRPPLALPDSAMGTMTVTGQRLPQLSPAQTTLLARTMFTEGAHDWNTPNLFQALGSTALKRQGIPRYGNSMDRILTAPSQFQGVGKISSNPSKPSLWQLSEHPDQLTGLNQKAYAEALRVAQGLADGSLSDNTGGATRFGSGPGNGIIPNDMQKDVDNGTYERSRPDIGNWAFLRPRRR